MATKLWIFYRGRPGRAAQLAHHLQRLSPDRARRAGVTSYTLYVGGVAARDPAARFLTGAPRPVAPGFDAAEAIGMSTGTRGVPPMADEADLFSEPPVSFHVSEHVMISLAQTAPANEWLAQILLVTWRGDLAADEAITRWRAHA